MTDTVSKLDEPNTKATIPDEAKNVLLYPFFARAKENGTDHVEQISRHYCRQMLFMLKMHGYELDATFFKDFNFVHEGLKAAIYRTMGKHHPLQDFFDDLTAKEENE
jgi:hypothetical protein